MATRKRSLPTRAPKKRPTHGGGVARPLSDRTTVATAKPPAGPPSHTDLLHARLQAGLHAPGKGHTEFHHAPPVTPNGHHGHASLLDSGTNTSPTLAARPPVNPAAGVPSGFHAPVQSAHVPLPWTPFPGSGNTMTSAGGHFTGSHVGAAVRGVSGALAGSGVAPAILGSPIVRHPGLPGT